MSDGKDPAIKLFGKTIPLPEIPADGGGCFVKRDDGASSSSSSSEADSKGVGEECELNDANKDIPEEKSIDKEEDRPDCTMSEEVADAILNDTHKPPSPENESTTGKPPSKAAEEEQSETSNPQEKTLKKPDKILPCPRCNSMDTKFCYYNNYNVKQPRHFCKSCQRYWTAGGTMRNVPVGAGRRKNKTSAAQFRQVTITEPLHHPALNANGTVLTFGSDTPLCESMASVLNIVDKKTNQNGFRKPEELRIQVPSDDDANSSASSDCHGFTPQVPCFPHGPWPYPWNPPVGPTFCSNPQMGPPFCPPPMPLPFYSAIPYWGCAVPGPWVPPPYTITPHSGPNSPSLGKHSREDESSKENEPEKCLWVPKTLRIDDPDEAAKSSIWATLGIKNDRSDSINGGRILKAFESKTGDKEKENDLIKETPPELQANPAALSRSLNFQESS